MQYWCWIGSAYINERLFGEYIWLWLAMFSSFLGYIPLSFLVRGNITVDGEHWWKFHIHEKRPTLIDGSQKVAFNMIMSVMRFNNRKCAI